MRIVSIFMLASLALTSACTREDAGSGLISTTAPSAMEAKFDLATSVIPFPNNILFSATADGTLNIPVTNPSDIGDPKVAMNALDGFSTVAPITTSFGAAIDETTISASSVRLFMVTSADPYSLGSVPPASYAVTGITRELGFGTEFKALAAPNDATVLVIKPVIPLKSNQNYMVVVTRALQSTSGEAARESLGFKLLKNTTALIDGAGASLIPGRDAATAQQLEGLRQLTQAMLNAATTASPAIAADDVVIAWSFKTQTMNKVLAKIRANSLTDPYATDPNNFIASSTPVSISASGLRPGTSDFYSFAKTAALGGNTALIDAYTSSGGANFNTIGSVVVGAVKLPYFLDEYSASNPNPLAPLTTMFQVDAYGSPALKSVQTVPFLMTIPNTSAPAALGSKWPVVIFQHGFTVDKTAMFGIANTLAKAGFATIAIDSVLHGNRTFGLDLANNTTGAAGADGIADTSGKHYLNLSSLLTSRDNIRQSVADLIHLTRLLENQAMDVVNNTNGAPGNDGATDLIVGVAPAAYLGHSNGGILGTLLAGVEPNIKTFVLVNPGGDYASILQGSGAFSPVVNAGLSAKGVTVGSADYAAFFVAAQTVVDDGDPLNYAALAATKKILLMKTLNDNVVPNAQTDNLSLALGLQQVAAVPGSAVWPLGVNASPFVGSGFTFFTQGTHSSVLTPSPADITGLDVITEMQSQAANYLGAALLPAGAKVVIGATPLPSTNAASTVVQ